MKKTYIQKLSMVLIAVLCMAGLFSVVNKSIEAKTSKKNKLSFSKSVSTMETGSTYKFKVKGIRNDGKAVTWLSSDTSIAKVGKKGKVTALQTGTVKITATIKKGNTGISKKLTVVDPSENADNQNTGDGQESPIYDFFNGTGSEDGDNDAAYEDLEVENDQVVNLSSQVEKQNSGFDDIGFTENEDMNRFCYSVFGEAVADSIKEDESNPVVSPLSAYFALSLTAEGAGGNTKTQFDTLLGNDMRETRILQLTESLKKVSGSTKLAIADSVWLDDDFEADASWLSKMVNSYQAEIYRANLSADAARTSMNHWVSNQTKGLIPSLLDKNLSEEARLVLMNTIYLKAKWAKTFEETATYQREFTNENGSKIETDFLNQYRTYYKYFTTQQADGVILPYDDGRLCMIAIRPQNGQTARQFAQSLDGTMIDAYLADAKSMEINLHLPKFTMETSMNMNDLLTGMGLTDAFNSKNADLSGLGKGTKITDGNLFISDVLQKVKVTVDEEGTEAAAVTAVIAETEAAMAGDETKPLEVDFNEPFVYIIADTRTPFGDEQKESIPLFLGVVTDLSGEPVGNS